MSGIHPTAHIEDGASIGDDVEIGPFCVIGCDVTLGAGVRIHPHVVITGQTSLGAGCEVFSFSTLGEPPQDIKYAGEPTRLEIGEKTVIREHVSIHRGTMNGDSVTRVGSGCFLMVSSHIAHDCTIGDNVILINRVTLAGHVQIGDHAIIGYNIPVQQFCRIGKHTYVVAPSMVAKDVIPFSIARGSRQGCTLQGLNLVGLKQRGFSRETIKALREAYKIVFDGPPQETVERAARVREQFADCVPVMELVSFIQDHPERTPIFPGKRSQASAEEAV